MRNCLHTVETVRVAYVESWRGVDGDPKRDIGGSPERGGKYIGKEKKKSCRRGRNGK